MQHKQGRKDSIHNIFTAAAFITISIISSTVLQYDDHFKRNDQIHSTGTLTHKYTHTHTQNTCGQRRKTHKTHTYSCKNAHAYRSADACIHQRLRQLSCAITAQRQGRALFPNVRDFIVSGHRQTCSFSRGPSQHFTWLDSIWSESRRALITTQRHCNVCMSGCVCACWHV